MSHESLAIAAGAANLRATRSNPLSSELNDVQTELLSAIAKAHADTDRVVVTGRGYSYPTAREAALKGTSARSGAK